MLEELNIIREFDELQKSLPLMYEPEVVMRAMHYYDKHKQINGGCKKYIGTDLYYEKMAERHDYMYNCLNCDFENLIGGK